MRKTVLITLSFTLMFVAIALLAGFYAVLSRPNPPLKPATATIGNTVFTIEVASTTISRARGLSYRDGLGENQGMLFLFGDYSNYGFWMKDMNFPLDMIWIKGDRVAGFSENAVPEPGVPMWKLKIYYPPEAVDKVLEVNAGTVARDGIKAGDLVSIRYE